MLRENSEEQKSGVEKAGEDLFIATIGSVKEYLEAVKLR